MIRSRSRMMRPAIRDQYRQTRAILLRSTDGPTYAMMPTRTSLYASYGGTRPTTTPSSATSPQNRRQAGRMTLAPGYPTAGRTNVTPDAMIGGRRLLGVRWHRYKAIPRRLAEIEFGHREQPAYRPFYRFMRQPTAVEGVRRLTVENDPDLAWQIFDRVAWTNMDVQPDGRFYHAMLMCCKRCMPGKAPAVLDVAIRRDVPVDDDLFSAFIDGCSTASPPLVSVVLERYSKYGPRSHRVMSNVARFCRQARQPSAALFLLSDALSNDVLVSDRLLSTLAACCAEAQCPEAADTADHLLDLIRSKRISSHRNPRVFVDLAETFLSQKRLDRIVPMLDVMESGGVPVPPRLYATLLSSFAEHDRVSEGLFVFQKMVDPGPGELSALIAAAGRCLELSALVSLHQHVQEKVNDELASALIVAYSDCDRLDLAERVFHDRCNVGAPGRATFNAVLDAYARHGLHQQALATFGQLKSAPVKSNQKTLALLLRSSSYAADLAGANAILHEFARTWDVRPNQEGTKYMIDLYGKAGDLDAAEKLATTPELRLSLLVAIGKHRDLARAERVFATIRSLKNAEPDLVTAYMVMMDLYAAVDRLRDVEHLRDELSARPVAEVPVRAMLLLDDRTVRFVSGDVDQDPILGDAHATMLQKLEGNGYNANLSVVTRKTSSGEEARRLVTRHACKLAVAYGLVTLPTDAPVVIACTQRMCADCHDAMKRLSALSKREIRIRDAVRHHRFYAGLCSCSDEW